MEQNLLSIGAWKRLWRETTDLLAMRGNRLRLILAILITATAALPELLFLQILDVVLNAFGEAAGSPATAVCLAVSAAYLVCFFLPLSSGLFYLAGRMEAEEETALADLFHAFTGARAYRSAMSCGLYLGIPLAAMLLTPSVITDRLAGTNGNLLQLLLAALLAVAADAALLFLFFGWFGGPYRAVHRTKPRIRHARRAGAWYWGRFLPHLILSVLSLLIYLIADILPRMLVLYFRFCREYDRFSTIQPEGDPS